MVSMNVGVGRPPRCATQVASGSIEAATSDAMSIRRGVVGEIIEKTRIRFVIHDRLMPGATDNGGAMKLLRIAMPIALPIMYPSPAVVFVSGVCGAKRR